MTRYMSMGECLPQVQQFQRGDPAQRLRHSSRALRAQFVRPAAAGAAVGV